MEAENVTQLTTTLSLAWALSMARVVLSFALTINFVIITINFVSSVRSSNSHPDLQLSHPPTFSDLACRPLYNNIGLSLSEPLKLYEKQSLDSSAVLIPYVQDSAR